MALCRTKKKTTSPKVKTRRRNKTRKKAFDRTPFEVDGKVPDNWWAECTQAERNWERPRWDTIGAFIQSNWFEGRDRGDKYSARAVVSKYEEIFLTPPEPRMEYSMVDVRVAYHLCEIDLNNWLALEDRAETYDGEKQMRKQIQAAKNSNFHGFSKLTRDLWNHQPWETVCGIPLPAKSSAPSVRKSPVMVRTKSKQKGVLVMTKKRAVKKSVTKAKSKSKSKTKAVKKAVRKAVKKSTPKIKAVKKAKTKKASGSIKGTLGKTLGLSVQGTFAKIFKDIATKKQGMTDAQISAFMKKEFAPYCSKAFDVIPAARSRYNGGVFTKGEAPVKLAGKYTKEDGFNNPKQEHNPLVDKPAPRKASTKAVSKVKVKAKGKAKAVVKKAVKKLRRTVA